MAPRYHRSGNSSSGSSGRGHGRGAYYAAKYGSRRGSRSAHQDGDAAESYDMSDSPSSSAQGLTRSRSQHGAGASTGGDIAEPSFENGNLIELSNFLKSVDGTQYPNYKPLRGSWRLSDTLLLIFDQIQGDAYAAPSRARLRVSLADTGFPDFLFSSPIRVIAFCDYISRKFAHFATVARLDYQRNAKGWASAKGGHVSIDAPGQHVLPRTSCVLDDGGKTLELRILTALPARGRTIEGHVADEALTQILPIVAEKALYAQGDDAERCSAHVRCVDEQDELRRKLPELGLVGFVAEGAILPRAGGDSDVPMDPTAAIRFRPPEGMSVDVRLSTGRQISGMGIKPGVSLIVGGGFHGKSTLLSALQVGVYNHVPGDGREFVCVVLDAVSIRAEDGRYVVGVDISPFIGNLPFGKTTESFTTTDASGSTSQAANIVEALEAGSKLLLIDEDLSATNLMIRDRRMQRLVPRNKEPITPLIQRIRVLYEHEGVSCILVVGGAGDYFDVADHVIMMDSYCPTDVTKKAKDIAREMAGSADLSPSVKIGKTEDEDSNNVIMSPANRVADAFKSKRQRRVAADSLKWIVNSGRSRVFARVKETVEVGAERIDLYAVAQLVEISQTRAIAAALERLVDMTELEAQGVAACVQKLFLRIDRKGLDVLNVRGERMGNYARPRPYELHAALNRLRGLQISNEKRVKVRAQA